jgi:hypothetical protein
MARLSLGHSVDERRKVQASQVCDGHSESLIPDGSTAELCSSEKTLLVSLVEREKYNSKFPVMDD